MQVDNCQITGGTNTIRNDAEFATLVGASLLDGGAVNANGGTGSPGPYALDTAIGQPDARVWRGGLRDSSV